jgi:hypothetical protein
MSSPYYAPGTSNSHFTYGTYSSNTPLSPVTSYENHELNQSCWHMPNSTTLSTTTDHILHLPGKKTYSKPRRRTSWAPHGVNIYYIGPAMDHYCRHRVYCSATGQDRIFNTIKCMPSQCKVPGLSSDDAATIAESYLAHALLHPAPETPFKQPGPERMQEIKELAAIFENMAPQHAPPSRVPDPSPHNIPSPRVPTTRPSSLITTSYFPGMTRRSPRQHQPTTITQEELAYHLFETPLPRIETSNAVTDSLIGQHID